MNDKEFYQKLDDIINELLKGIGNIVLEDYGKLNDVCMEISRRKFLANAELKIEGVVK